MLKELEGYKPTLKLKYFPIEIIEKIASYQKEQTGKINLRIFENYPGATLKEEGFDWYKTPEGPTFWRDILTFKNIYIFFLKYPRPANSNKLRFVEGYKPTPMSPLKALPLEILDKMVEYQVKQGNKASIKVFEDNILASKATGGFNWSNTKEKIHFWSKIIRNFEHHEFFLEYPYKVFPVKVLSNNKPVILLSYDQETKSGLGITKKDKTIKFYNNIEPIKRGIKNGINNFNYLLGYTAKNKFTGREVFIRNISIVGKNDDVVFNEKSGNTLDTITFRELIHCYK